MSRNIDPNEMAVINVGKVKGGTAENMIADYFFMEGMTRSFDI